MWVCGYVYVYVYVYVCVYALWGEVRVYVGMYMCVCMHGGKSVCGYVGMCMYICMHYVCCGGMGVGSESMFVYDTAVRCMSR